PVGEQEVDFIYEYLNLLVERPEIARAMGERARRWVLENCSWDRVACQYAGFLEAVAQGREWSPPAPQPAPSAPLPAPETPLTEIATEPPEHPWAGYILGYASASQEQLGYVRTHLTRLVHTLEITPPGTAADRILEMGAYMHITPALQNLLGYGEVRGSYLGPLGRVDRREARSSSGEVFSCFIDCFDAEKDPFPYPDGHFSTVLCCELLEHLYHDPMHMMSEINRILRPGGALVLTTPNICSLRAINAILLTYHPGFFHQYIRPEPDGEIAPRHNREYAPRDVQLLLEQAGFAVALLETAPYLVEPSAANEWVLHLLDRYGLSKDFRDEGIYAVGKKVSGVKCRYPEGLYTGDGP
ncbi:MAG TPA: methyltransferase domain-containing protein, partial [Bryobacterales bacterium]|nr:methyltransferase domain-containing protein [Bryobacterales bacterium]